MQFFDRIKNYFSPPEFQCPLCGSRSSYKVLCESRGGHPSQKWLAAVNEAPYSNWKTFRRPRQELALAGTPRMVCFSGEDTHESPRENLTNYSRCKQCYSLLPDTFLRNSVRSTDSHAVLYLIGSSGVGKSTWYAQTLTRRNHIWGRTENPILVRDTFYFMEPYTQDYLATTARTNIDFLFGGFHFSPNEESKRTVHCSIIDRLGEEVQRLSTDQQQREIIRLHDFSRRRSLSVYLVIPYYCPYSNWSPVAEQQFTGRPWIERPEVFRACFDYVDRIRRQFRTERVNYGILWTRLDEHCDCSCQKNGDCENCHQARELLGDMLGVSGFRERAYLQSCKKGDVTITGSASAPTLDETLARTKTYFQRWIQSHLSRGGDHAVWKPIETLLAGMDLTIFPMARVIPCANLPNGKTEETESDGMGVWYDIPLQWMWQQIWER